MDFSTKLNALVTQVESAIDALLPPAATRPGRIHEAMRYSMQAGGKRLRPVLLISACEVFSHDIGGDRAKSVAPSPLAAAVAIECVHTYSLVHDDLPCMDNDDLRRGRATAHRQFDEATALLAGDALLTYAFELLSRQYPAAISHALLRELADAAGSRRLVGGQMEDLLAEKDAHATASTLEFIHLNKTAAMVEASLVMGGIVAQAPDPILTGLRAFGRELGLTFQIVDDILDATADTSVLGKTAGKDAKAGKTTFVSLYGLERARALAEEHSQSALSHLATVDGDTRFLHELAASLLARTH